MFDQLFRRASTIARHARAPYAEERVRYLEYCSLRGHSLAWQVCKAAQLLWIARKLSCYPDLHVTIDQVRALVSDCSAGQSIGGPKLHLLSTRKRLFGTACAWLRHLDYLREPVEQIPFGSHLDEYCDWAKQERGLSPASIDRFRRTIRQFLRWYGELGRPLSAIHANDIDAYLAFGSGHGWVRVTVRNVVDALRAFFRFGAEQGWCGPHLAEAIQAADLCSGATAYGARVGGSAAAVCGPRYESSSGGARPRHPDAVRDLRLARERSRQASSG
jgi:integrase/recombinase XerD